jgi:hypothetical protein
VATLVMSIVEAVDPAADRSRVLAVRWGTALSLAGMAVGGLMMLPARGAPRPPSIAGAHTVGAPDGGPGLPFLGWSTEHGDLRVPHFVGIHALQAIPIVLVILEQLAARVPALRSVALRARLTTVAGVTYAAILSLLSWQALRAQSLVHPDHWTLAAALLIVAGTATGTVRALRDPGPAPTSAIDSTAAEGVSR